MNKFEGEQPDTESEDEGYAPSLFTFISNGTSWAQALQRSNYEHKATPTIIAFAALKNDEDDIDNNDFKMDDSSEQLNGWAHRAHVMK